MSVSTHVLDTAGGRPASGVPVRLEVRDGEHWRPLEERATNDDGRVPELAGAHCGGMYRLVFDTGKLFGGNGFYPEVVVVFQVRDAREHHHVPLLISPFGYSTYRGS